MGGYGSGRRWGFTKGTVDGCPSLRIEQQFGKRFASSAVHNFGQLVWTYSGTNKEALSIGYEVNTLFRHDAWARFYYTHPGTLERLDYRVGLTFTEPNFGGLRWWFFCQVGGENCNRRVSRLCLPAGEKYFGCRTCYDLTYASCQDSHKYDRVFARVAEGFPGMTPRAAERLLKSKWKKSRVA